MRPEDADADGVQSATGHIAEEDCPGAGDGGTDRHVEQRGRIGARGDENLTVVAEVAGDAQVSAGFEP